MTGNTMGRLPVTAAPMALQRGFSMIEVLVTLLIISLALLGTAGLQAYSMRLNQGGQFRTQAVFLVADLAERMEANKGGATAGAYALANGNVPNAPSTACQDAPCGAVALATYDLTQWQNAVAATLPQSSWTVTETVAGNPATYTITVGWVDRRQEQNNASGSAGITYEAFNAGTQTGLDATGTGERFFYTATRTIAN
jgi:type IV pilus assembly protein PilV